MKRFLAAVALAAITFWLGLCVGSGREPEPDLPPSGEELWQSLPPELLSNVAEGIMEHISSLQDDLARVQTIQAEKLNE